MSSAHRFEVLPAMDLVDGRVVRLVQGRFDQATTYAEDPVAVAERFLAAGARWIHLVDLDGARTGAPVQAATVARVVAAVAGRAACQVAGGLRSDTAVEAAFAVGAERVVIGTAALRDPSFAARLVDRHGAARVVVALDVRDGLALGEGWRAGAPGIDPVVALERLADAGVESFAVTSIDRDGLLEGPDLVLLRQLVGHRRGRIIASGGVRSVEDVEAVRRLGCSGAIIGRALYEGRLDLAEAIARLAG